MQAAGAMRSTAAAPGGVPTYALATPMGQPGWGQAMGERLSFLVRNGVQQARIRLDPPQLGPVEIAIAMKEDRASVQIVAQHHATREALEAELPRLRAMLEESGFGGADVDVSRGGGDGKPGRSLFAQALSQANGEEAEAVTETVSTPAAGRGLVDQYA